MSAKRADDEKFHDEGDEEEDEEDFVPGAEDYEEDEDDFNVVGDDDVEDEDNTGGLPAFLQGTMTIQPNGYLSYSNNAEADPFELKSKKRIGGWNFQNPQTESPIASHFKLADQPSQNFELLFLKQDYQIVKHDALAMQLFTAQTQQKAAASVSAAASAAATIELPDTKQAASLKNPPFASPTSSLKQPPSASASPTQAAATSDDNVVYTVVGKQIEQSNGGKIEFTGYYRPSEDISTADATSVFLICLTKHVTAASATAAPAAAAVSRKRRNLDEDDDDDVENDGGVEYNELIALHDDANLSVEELRRKYNSSSSPTTNTTTAAAAAAPASKRTRRSSSDAKMSAKADNDDDDDDDDQKSSANSNNKKGANGQDDDDDDDDDDDIGF